MNKTLYPRELRQDVTLNDLLNFFKESLNIYPELREDHLINHHINLVQDMIDRVGSKTLIRDVGTLSNQYIDPLPEQDMIQYANYFLDDAVQWSWENC